MQDKDGSFLLKKAMLALEGGDPVGFATSAGKPVDLIRTADAISQESVDLYVVFAGETLPEPPSEGGGDKGRGVEGGGGGGGSGGGELGNNPLAAEVIAAAEALKEFEDREAAVNAKIKAGEAERAAGMPEKAGAAARRRADESKQLAALEKERGELEAKRDAANAAATKGGLKVADILATQKAPPGRAAAGSDAAGDGAASNAVPPGGDGAGSSGVGTPARAEMTAAAAEMAALEAKAAEFELKLRVADEERSKVLAGGAEKPHLQKARLAREEKQRDALAAEKAGVEAKLASAREKAAAEGVDVSDLEPARTAVSDSGGGGAAGGGAGGGTAPTEAAVPVGDGGGAVGKSVRQDMKALAAEWEAVAADGSALEDKFAAADAERAKANKVEKQAVVDGRAKSEAKQRAAVVAKREALEVRRAAIVAAATAAGVDVSDLDPAAAAAAGGGSGGGSGYARVVENGKVKIILHRSDGKTEMVSAALDKTGSFLLKKASLVWPEGGEPVGLTTMDGQPLNDLDTSIDVITGITCDLRVVCAGDAPASGGGGEGGGGGGGGGSGGDPTELRAAVSAAVASLQEAEAKAAALEQKFSNAEAERAKENKKEKQAVVDGRAKSEAKQRDAVVAEVDAAEAAKQKALAAAAAAGVDASDLLPRPAAGAPPPLSAEDAAAAAAVDKINANAAKAAADAAALREAAVAAAAELEALGPLLADWEARKEALEAKFSAADAERAASGKKEKQGVVDGRLKSEAKQRAMLEEEGAGLDARKAAAEATLAAAGESKPVKAAAPAGPGGGGGSDLTLPPAWEPQLGVGGGYVGTLCTSRMGHLYRAIHTGHYTTAPKLAILSYPFFPCCFELNVRRCALGLGASAWTHSA